MNRTVRCAHIQEDLLPAELSVRSAIPVILWGRGVEVPGEGKTIWIWDSHP